MKLKNFFTKVALGLLSVCALVLVAAVSPITASAEGELTITVQPQQSIRYASENADFYVEATGGTAPYAYQWQWIGYDAYYDGGAWSDISESDNATLTVAVTEDMSGNFYRCIITDSASVTVTSEEAMLFVPYLPNIKTNLSFAKGHNTELDLAYFSGRPSNYNDYTTLKLISDGQNFIDPLIRWENQVANHYFLSVYPTGKFTAMNETDTWNNESEHGLLVAVSDDTGLLYGQTINLQFSQMLTKVNLDLSFDGFATEPTVSEVRIYCGNDYTINYLIYEITADAYTYDANEYSSFTQEGKSSWSSIVVPQTGVRRIEVEIDGTVYTYESAEDITMNSGKAVDLALTVTSGNSTVTATSTAESDWVTTTLGHTFDTNGECSCGAVEISDTTFPDATFRTYITENIDTDKDGALSSEEIAAVTEMDISIEASYSYTYISDLTGIEYFTNLVTLNASSTNIASIDVSAFTKLEWLYLYNCFYLKSLDLTANTNLAVLDVSGTGLTELDLSHNSNAGLNMGENTSIVTLEHCGVGYVDMSQFADLSRMTIVSGGTMGEDGWLKLDADVTKVVYEYDTKSNPHIAAYFYVEIYINSNNVAHAYVDAAVSKDETGHYAQSCSICRTFDETTVEAHTDSDDNAYCDACGGFAFPGTGTEADPYIVTTFEQLNAALHSTENETNYVKLGNTISWYIAFKGSLLLEETKPFVLDLNGYQLWAPDSQFVVYGTSAIVRNGRLRLDRVQSYYGNGNIEIIDVEMDVRKIDATGGTLTLSDCNVFCRYLSTDSNGTIIARAVTIKYSEYVEGEIGYECLSGSLTLDGVTYTESIEILNYHTHTDANGDCVCDREGDALHGGTLVPTANNDGTHNIVCGLCNQIVETVSCTPVSPDGDCTTDEVCACGYLIEGRASHTGGSATCTAKAECAICGTKYGSTIAHNYTLPQKDSTDHWNKCSECDAIDAKIAHSGTDDGDCKTPVTCACGHVVTEAEDDHSFTDACDATCNNTGCVYTREITHVYDNVCDADCNNCGAVREVGEHRYGEDNICDECGHEKQTESIPENSTPDESVPESSAPNDSEEETSSKEEGIKIGGCFSQMDGSVLFLLGLLTLAVALKRKKA